MIIEVMILITKLKIFNILNDPYKLEQKNIDFLPVEPPLLTRSSNCPELQREYNKQYLRIKISYIETCQ